MDFKEKIFFISVIIFSIQMTRFAPLILPARAREIFSDEKLNERINKVIFLFLILYCYRDFSFSSEYLLRLGCGVLVFLIQFFSGITLLSVFLGTGIYMGVRLFLIGV